MSINPLEHLCPVWTRIFNVEAERGEGIYLFDLAGRRYIDFTCGIGVTNTGHCHPRVVKAVQEQAAKLLHGQINIILQQPALQLVKALLPLLPQGLDTIFFSNSGAEAVEAAVKLAKHATGRTNVIVFTGGFHGRTHLTMAMTTSKTGYRLHYQPLVPGIFVAPYPYLYQLGMDEESATRFCIKELKRLLKSQTAPDETACAVIEPELGEGGYIAPPNRFLLELQDLCHEHGILLVADEVQSGYGRTGKFFACEHSGIVPDILVMAKGMASGIPLSGIATRRDLTARWRTGSHGGTYGGNAVACAAGVATIQAILEEHLLENTTQRGLELVAGLSRLQQQYPCIGEVRGLGLMIGVEFSKLDREPDPITTKAVVKEAAQRGLLLLTAGTYDNVIRWIPPLVVSSDQIQEALSIFGEALAAGIRQTV
jgi:4-aminobutyrate aminotransferase